ncbi:MAG: 2-hydroxyacyl-CoA dehydratase [Actinobacteria bacterium]|nr:2-hydroxyacyl-CoA dehydratase [Actinomycetota bacterium]
MGLAEHLVEKYKNKASPSLLRSSKFWNTVIKIANNPINKPSSEADHVSANFMLNMTRDAFLRRKPVVWANLLFPSELLHGLDTIGFFPEFAAAVAAMTGLSERFLQTADAAGFSQDLCSFHRVIIGAALESFLPEPDYIVCSSTPCDSAPLSFMFLADHYNVPNFCIDIPSRIDSNEDLEPVSQQLEEFTLAVSGAAGAGKQEAVKKIGEAVTLSNEARGYALQMESLIENHPPLINGWDAIGNLSVLIATPGTQSSVEYFRNMVDDLKNGRFEPGGNTKDPNRYKLLWMHLRPYFRNGIDEFLKDNQAAVVCEEYSRWYGPEMDPGDPFLSLAEKMAAHPLAGSSRRRMEVIKELARNHEVDGAVHFNHRGCRQSCGCAQQVKDELASIGIKTLILDGECIDESEHREGQLMTRLEAFFETLE